MPAASTDPVRAWESGNRWFLAQRGKGAGKLRHGSPSRCCRTEGGRRIGRGRRQGNGMAGLAGAARFAMRICPMVHPGSVSVGTIASCRGGMPRLLRIRRKHPAGRFMKMGCRCLKCCLLMRRPGSHAGGHGITGPAAQRQQENHKNKDQVAHELVGFRRFMKSSLLFQGLKNFCFLGFFCIQVQGNPGNASFRAPSPARLIVGDG